MLAFSIGDSFRLPDGFGDSRWEPPSLRRPLAFNLAQRIGVAGALLLFFGVLLPGLESVPLLRKTEGLIVLGLAMASLVFALRDYTVVLGCTGFICFLALVSVYLLTATGWNIAFSRAGGPSRSPDFGIGWWLTQAGALLLLTAAVVGEVLPPRPPRFRLPEMDFPDFPPAEASH